MTGDATGSVDSENRPSYQLFVYPDYSAANPFQAMLHARLADVDAEAVRVPDLWQHLRARAEGPGDPGVLSVHWTGPILACAGGPFRSRLLLDRFEALLDRFLDAGGRLVWTLHNVLPHEHAHRWAEVELSQFLADRADLVHVLSEQTAALVAPSYHLDPAKVVVIEHASYLGCYPDSMPREQARARLGLRADQVALVALGGIRPYKNLDTLVDVVDDLGTRDPALQLLVAGRVTPSPAAELLRERCERDPRVTASFEHVPDEEIQVWMKAADLAVLPYRDILNSGAFLLAETFGLPVVAPRAGALCGSEHRAHVRLFAPGDRASLAEAITQVVAAVRHDPEAMREHALAAARARPPEAMAAAFARAIAPLLPSRR